VLFWVSRAIARRDYQRIGPETALRARLTDLQAYYDGQGVEGERRDKELLKDRPVRLTGTENRHKAMQKSHAEVRFLGGLRSSVITVYRGVACGTERIRSPARAMQNWWVCGTPKLCESQSAYGISMI
jgi:hypothetical protein